MGGFETARNDYDIVVVGLGPVGATLAALLAQRGLSVLAIEKSVDVYPLPRAVGFDHEVMRIFQHLGIADEVVKHTRFSPYYDFVNRNMQTLISFDRSSGTSASGWPPNVTFHQPSVEVLLREAIQNEDTGELRLGCSFTGVFEDDDGLEITVENPEGEVAVRAKYLIGCDGGSSAVRKAMKISLDDLDFDEPWLVVDFLSDDLSGLPDRNIQICDPARPATYMQMGPGRYRWEFMILPDDDPDQITSDTAIRNLLNSYGIARRDPIERRAVYRFHGLVAERWRDGRVILAGDAAHQTPPFAGQGMCSGLRDAFNLAWKLEDILRNGADDLLLDSYQIEREPPVRFIIDSAIRMGKVVCTTDEATARERDERLLADRKAGKAPISMVYPPLSGGVTLDDTPGAGTFFIQPWSQVGGATIKFDDVLGHGPVLLCRRDIGPKINGIKAIAVNGPDAAPFSADLVHWLDEHDAEAVLIRPDLYVFATGAPEDLARSYLEHCRIGATTVQA
jgi:3-(3-hydroxy-phenyl)propionate hydroxylase